jgi:hypothetical protein
VYVAVMVPASWLPLCRTAVKEQNASLLLLLLLLPAGLGRAHAAASQV